MEDTDNTPTYTWHPEYEPMVDAYVETKWKETIYLSISSPSYEDSSFDSTSVQKYEWAWVGDVLEGVDITSDENGVHLDAYDVSADIFPAVDIEYQLHEGDKPPFRETYHTDNFRNIPAENRAEIIRYIPNPKQTKSFLLNVTAFLSDGMEMTAGFTVVIWTDYSIGKKSLQEAIRACSR